MKIERNTVHQMEAIELMKQLDDASVDAYILDLPYGTTACTWDTIIPFEPMWREVKRTLKPRGVFVTTTTEPFTSLLVVSNLEMFRYKWAWNKGQGSDFQLAKLRPLSVIEDVCVFSQGRTANGAALNMAYYPQMKRRDKPVTSGGAPNAKYLNPHNMTALHNTYDESYPVSLIEFNKDVGIDRIHPTQKPVALYEYLIRTYTQPGELVVDFCCGSGTTAVAARNTKRDFIVGDTDAHYCNVARERLRQPYERHYVKRDEDVTTMDVKDGYKNHLFAVSEA